MKRYLEEMKHFYLQIAKSLDQQRERAFTRYNEFAEQLLLYIPFPKDAKLRMLDLGAGTGYTSMKVLKKFQNAHITCVEFSKDILALARRRLQPYGNRVKFVESEISEFKFEGKYDVVYSGLALVHLNHEDRKKLAKKVYEHLNNGGCFTYVENIHFKTPEMQKKAYDTQMAFMKKNLSPEIFNHWRRHFEEDDLTAPIGEQFSWLKEAGFKKVEVVWLHLIWAVFCAIK